MHAGSLYAIGTMGGYDAVQSIPTLHACEQDNVVLVM